MSKTVGVGLIGSQFISSIHARSLQQCPRVDTLAVCSPTPGNAEQFSQQFNIPNYFTDHRRMFEMSEIDMVDIGAPNHVHCELVCDIAAAGKHVVLEKPMCLSLAEADRMIAACQQANVKLMYAEQLCFAPKYVRLKQLNDIRNSKHENMNLQSPAKAPCPNHIFRLITLLCTLGLFIELCAAAEAQPPNLVVNGDFENGDELPTWWHRHPRENVPGNQHLRDTAVAHGGRASGLLVAVNPEHVGSAGVQWNRYGIPIEGVGALAVSYWVKTEGVAATGAGCHFYGDQRRHLGFFPVPGPGDADDWCHVRRTIHVPEGAKTMGFALYAADGGKTWYDDVRVEPDTEAAARRAAVREHFAIPAAGEGNGPFRIVVAHSLQKIPRHEAVNDGEIMQKIELEAARDETEAFQLVVIPAGKQLANVQVETPPLTGPGGELPISWSYVGYVKTAPPKYPVPYVGWWPDPLLPPRSFSVPADQRQPLWFQVDVPPDAQPGEYTGRVTVRHAEQEVTTPVKLTVRSFRLPRPGTLATPFGLYASALVRGYEAEAGYREAMPVDAFARWCQFLGVRRLAPKNVAREYIDVTRQNGQWQVDLSALDRTVANLAPRYFSANSFCLHRLPVAATLWKGGPKPDPTAWADVTAAIAAQWKRRDLPSEVYNLWPG